jgi:hypothetical protein
MKRKEIIAFIFLVSFSCLFSQKTEQKKPTKKETQKFITQTIKEHSYCSKEDGIINKFIVSFNDTAIVIYNFKGATTYYTTFKVADIDTFSIAEKDFNVWLILLLKPGKKETTFFNSTPMNKPLGLYEILLNKTFLRDDLPVKMGEAFNNLMRFYD